MAWIMGLHTAVIVLLFVMMWQSIRIDQIVYDRLKDLDGLNRSSLNVAVRLAEKIATLEAAQAEMAQALHDLRNQIVNEVQA